MVLNIAHHKNVLIRILKDIFTDSVLMPCLGFNGGTAAMLFYDLSRFSVDLDFDLLDATKEELVFARLKELLASYGTVKEQKKRYSLFFLLSYQDKVHEGQNVKVEINKRNFGSCYEVKYYLGIPMRVMVQEDMAAHKLVAMYECLGSSNRDIFDVWFFFHNQWPVNKDIVEQRTHMSYKAFLQVCIDRLEKMSDRGLLSGIGELIDEKQKAWVRHSLRKETIFLLTLALQEA